MAEGPIKSRKLQRTLRDIGKQTRRAINVVLDRQAVLLRGRAVAIAPELTRRLILSSKITSRNQKGKAIRVVSFDTPYAVTRHESFYNLGPISSQKAPTQDGPTGRKYLSRPFNNLVREKGVEKEIRDALLKVARRNRSKVR